MMTNLGEYGDKFYRKLVLGGFKCETGVEIGTLEESTYQIPHNREGEIVYQRVKIL